jgi:hypothetical protein
MKRKSKNHNLQCYVFQKRQKSNTYNFISIMFRDNWKMNTYTSWWWMPNKSQLSCVPSAICSPSSRESISTKPGGRLFKVLSNCPTNISLGYATSKNCVVLTESFIFKKLTWIFLEFGTPPKQGLEALWVNYLKHSSPSLQLGSLHSFD